MADANALKAQGAAPIANAPAPLAPVDLALLQPEQRVRALSPVWRVATDRDTPTLLQLLAAGGLTRVDVDATAGYVAVVTPDETYRALGVRRDAVEWLVAVIANVAIDEVRVRLAAGPAKIDVVPNGVGNSP